MSGKGELVKFTRLFERGPLTPAKKKKLKDEINAIIDAASNSITIEAMVEASTKDLEDELEKRKKRRG